MAGSDIFLSLGALILSLAGLLGFDWLCSTNDIRRYRRWVEEREHILTELERSTSSQEADSDL